MKKSFFHHSNVKLCVLTVQHGRRRHGGEAANAVGQKVVYLHDRPMPSARDGGEPFKYEHEVRIRPDDPLLEQEDPNWAPSVWIYRGKLRVVAVRVWDEASQKHVFSSSWAECSARIRKLIAG